MVVSFVCVNLKRKVYVLHDFLFDFAKVDMTKNVKTTDSTNHGVLVL